MTGTTNPGHDYKGEYEALAHALVGNTGARRYWRHPGINGC